MKILTLAASLRQGSFNLKLIKIASMIVEKQGCSVECVDFSEFDIPLYNGDIEETKGIPQNAIRFKEKMEACDGIIISSPEYNYSTPGTIKNATDWVSRIRPQPFKGKNILVMSASPSAVGGVRGLWHLRVPLEGLGAFVYPEMFSLAVAHEAFDSKDELKDNKLTEALTNNIKGFLDNIKNTCR
jgi:NAD(P)H-dependent FMN reductase